jgi:peptidoglycan/xylan/chitin deacetylase (PgdA/CDA1 family)
VSAGGTLVLLYHRVTDLRCDPHGLAVRPDRFAAHCEILKKHCDVVRLCQANPSRRQVAITFDDGYVDNAGAARDILTAADLPATFFVTIGRVGQPGQAWWDRLAQIFLESEITAGTIDLEIGRRRLWADIRSPAARERAHLAVFWRLRSLPQAEIESALSGIERQLGVRSFDRETHRWMTIAELRTLCDNESFDIGAHTLTHPFLPSIPVDQQWQEIHGSREAVEELLGTRSTLFSYPYGGPDAVGTNAMELVRKAGYTIACTTSGGIARADSDRLLIPRNVVGNWEADRFERWLNDWLRQA